MKKFSTYLSMSIVLAGFSFLFADETIVLRKKHFNLEKNLAVQGYDVVAYFIQKKAVKGLEKNIFVYKGVTYYFSTPKHIEIFKKNPGKYEPQYGGWCAYETGKGSKRSINPETFKILDNKLYLFFNKWFINTLSMWNKDEANLLKRPMKVGKKYFNKSLK